MAASRRVSAGQRLCQAVMSCSRVGARENFVMPEFAVALGKSGPWAYARFAPSRKAHKSLYVTYKRRVGVISKSAVDIAAGHRGRLRFDLDVRRARHRQVAPPALVMSMAYLTGSWDCRGIAERDVLIYDAPAPLVGTWEEPLCKQSMRWRWRFRRLWARCRCSPRPARQAKPPVYVVTEIAVTNLDAYVKEYSPLAQAGIKNAGGKNSRCWTEGDDIRGNAAEQPRSHSAMGQPRKSQAWRNSAEFKKAREVGDKCAKFRSFAIEGMPQ